MDRSITWLHVGDLHVDAGDNWEGSRRLRAIVSEANAHLTRLDFVFLPGDSANHGRPEEYAAMLTALAPLSLPWRVIPGDHDFEPGSLNAYHRAVPDAYRPKVEIIGGYRCIFLDVVSSGSGGPDFRLDQATQKQLKRELGLAREQDQHSVVFMHAYPEDLGTDGAEIGRIIAEGGARFVSTGHTHYNEILNDGRVIYSATRSTAQIEEADGIPGYAITCLHDGVPSWRFREIGAAWPALQIVSPADLRLVTRVQDRRQVPHPGEIDIVVRSFGDTPDDIDLTVDGRPVGVMQPGDAGFWHAVVRIEDAGLHRITVTNGAACDEIDVLIRDPDAIPRRPQPVAPGASCHTIGAWPRAGLLATRLGPNSNGRQW